MQAFASSNNVLRMPSSPVVALVTCSAKTMYKVDLAHAEKATRESCGEGSEPTQSIKPFLRVVSKPLAAR